MGELLRNGLGKLDKNFVVGYRGKGLLNALIINNGDYKEIFISFDKFLFCFNLFILGRIDAFDFCLKLKDNGLLTKPTHDNILRLAPPLVINAGEVEEALSIIEKTINQVK